MHPELARSTVPREPGRSRAAMPAVMRRQADGRAPGQARRRPAWRWSPVPPTGGRRAVRPRESRVPLIRPQRRSARRRSPSAGHVPTPAARPLELALIGRSSDRGRYRERPSSSVWLTQPHIQMLLRFREPDCPVSRPRSTAVAHQATPLSPSAPRRAYESARPETVCGREREPRL